MLTEFVITAAKLLIPALADALEGIRVGMIILECERKSINRIKHQAMNEVRDADEFFVCFHKLQEDINATEEKLKEAKKKLKLTPKVMKQKYNSAKCDVTHYEFELKELKFKMQNILSQNECETEQDILDTKPYFEKMRRFEIPKLEAEEKRMEAEIQKTLTQHQETEKQVDEADKEELKAERMKIRPEKEKEARQTVETNYNISEYDFNRSVDTVSKLIGEPPPNYLTEAEIARQEEYARYVKQQEERRKYYEELRERQYQPREQKKTIGYER